MNRYYQKYKLKKLLGSFVPRLKQTDLLKSHTSSVRAKQVLGLFSVNVIGMPIGIITSVVVSRYLGAKGYGDFKFIQSIFNFAIIIFTFGFFQAGNRALVLNYDKQKAKEYYGTELIITGGLFIVMSACLAFYVLFDLNIQEKQLSNFLLFTIPFGWVFLLLRLFETLFQADNRINMLAKVRLFPKVGFLLLATTIFFAFRSWSINRLAIIWSIYLFAEAICYLSILFQLKVSFKNFKVRLNEIWSYNKSFGLNVYLGSLFAVGFGQFTQILISYFGIDNSGVGFYALALTFTVPLTVIPNTIATTHYKDFSAGKKIPGKLLLITLGLSFAALVGLWLIVPSFVSIFYGSGFESVIFLNFIVSIGVTAHGFGDFFNRYLGANGQGKALRNSSIIFGVALLVMNITFIPTWKEKGAAFACLISGFIYLINMIIYYKLYQKRVLND